MRAKLSPGAVVLLHDGVGRFSKYSSTREATVAALPEVLNICKERDLTPVVLSDVLKVGS